MGAESRVSCKGGCGKSRAYSEPDKGGYAMCQGDKIVEYVCDDCWKKGTRTTAAAAK